MTGIISSLIASRSNSDFQRVKFQMMQELCRQKSRQLEQSYEELTLKTLRGVATRKPETTPCAGAGNDTVSRKQELVILRGVPGAGKTTFSQVLVRAGFKHYESDAWRNFGPERVYSSKRNIVAHAWCLVQTAQALADRHDVVVSNVFSRIEDFKPYFLLAEDLAVRGYQIKTTVMTVEGPIGRSVNTGVDYMQYVNEWERYVGEFSVNN